MAEIGDGDVGNVVRKEAAGGRAALAVWCLGCRVFTVFLLLAVNRVCAAPPVFVIYPCWLYRFVLTYPVQFCTVHTERYITGTVQ